MPAHRCFALIALLVWSAQPIFGQTETIALIGTGEVSRAFGPRLAELGHQVVYGSRTPGRADVQEMVRAAGDGASAALPADAAAQADIVMLNVPWSVAEEVALGLGDLSGKIVIGLAEALGYEAVDLGPVRYAHVVEGLYLLRTNARDLAGEHFEFHFRRRETTVPQTIR